MFVKGNRISQRLSKIIRGLVGFKIKTHRKSLGISQAELGRRTGFGSSGVTRERIRQIEGGKDAAPNIGTLYALCAALEIELVDIMPSVKEVLDRAKIEMKEKVIIKKKLASLTYVGDMSKESNE